MADGNGRVTDSTMLNSVFSWWEGASQRWRGLAALDRLEEDEVERIAAEMGVSSGELKRIAREPDGIPVLLCRRLTALNLTPSEIRTVAPLMMRDLARTCTSCAVKQQCEADLAAGSASTAWQHYCPNSESLRSLS